MTPTFDKIHLKFKLNGINFNHDELKEVAYSLVKEGEAYERVVGNFLLDWLDDKAYVFVKTSGSTGLPKTVKLLKKLMVNSAIMTGDFFNIKPGDRALHCLPSRYIAGKMMLVRAMILGLELDLIAPSSNPAYDNEIPYDFCAMVPLQLKNSVHRLENIKLLIVGGARVNDELVDLVKGLETHVYETYGMTETISHVAVKKLNHTTEKVPAFKTLQNVTISQDDRNCLIIDAPKLTTEKVITNDMVELVSKNQFQLVGRFDNVINSGGVKVFPELIELKLQGLIGHRFFITSQKDKDLGEKVILIVEGDLKDFDKDLFAHLEKFEVPKAIYNVPKLIYTETGKLLRKETLATIIPR